MALERQLIHRLALSEHITYSELANSLPKRLVELKSFPSALASVADYIAPHGMSQGRYVLKKAMWRHFDAHFPLYSMQELHRAHERAQRFLPPTAPPPEPPAACAAFRGLAELAGCGGLHALVYAVCYAATKRFALAAPVSERLLSGALRLLQLALAAPRHHDGTLEQPPAPPTPPFGHAIVGCTLQLYAGQVGSARREASIKPFLGGIQGWQRVSVIHFDEASGRHTLRLEPKRGKAMS